MMLVAKAEAGSMGERWREFFCVVILKSIPDATAAGQNPLQQFKKDRRHPPISKRNGMRNKICVNRRRSALHPA